MKPTAEEIAERVRADDRRDDWSALGEAVEELVLPALAAQGPPALDDLVRERGSSPYAAAALVDVAWRRGWSPLSLFDREELLEAAVRFLHAFPSGGIADGKWAWLAIVFGGLGQQEQRELVLELVERAPWDDVALWILGDLAIGEITNEPGSFARIEELARTNEKLARVLELVEERS